MSAILAAVCIWLLYYWCACTYSTAFSACEATQVNLMKSAVTFSPGQYLACPCRGLGIPPTLFFFENTFWTFLSLNVHKQMFVRPDATISELTIPGTATLLMSLLVVTYFIISIFSGDVTLRYCVKMSLEACRAKIVTSACYSPQPGCVPVSLHSKFSKSVLCNLSHDLWD